MSRHSKSGLKKFVSAVQKIASSFGAPNNSMLYLHHNRRYEHLPGQEARNKSCEQQHYKPFFNRRIG